MHPQLLEEKTWIRNYVPCALPMFNLVLKQTAGICFVVQAPKNSTKLNTQLEFANAGQCWLAYRNHGNYLGAVRCPVCRQQVSWYNHDPDTVVYIFSFIQNLHRWQYSFKLSLTVSLIRLSCKKQKPELDCSKKSTSTIAGSAGSQDQ